MKCYNNNHLQENKLMKKKHGDYTIDKYLPMQRNVKKCFTHLVVFSGGSLKKTHG